MGITCLLWAVTDRQVLPFFLNAEGFLAFLRQVPEDCKIDLDKSWHGIHFLLSRCDFKSSPYTSFLLSGGHRIPLSVQVPAPTRAFLSSEVKVIASILSNISDKMLMSYYQPQIMNHLEIYPEEWSNLNEENDWVQNYLVGSFSGLKEFVIHAASQNFSVIIDYR